MSTRSILTFHAKNSVSVALIRFIVHGVKSWFTTLTPLVLVFHPITTILNFALYPAFFAAVVLLTALYSIGKRLGGRQFISRCAKTYAFDFSMANWLDPTIFDEESIGVMQAGTAILEGNMKTTIPRTIGTYDGEDQSYAVTRIFSVPLARSFLLMSAILYERLDGKMRQAVYAKSDEAVSEVSMKLYHQSNSHIQKQAARWDVNVDIVGSFSTTGGPFAAVFYPKRVREGQKPWISLVFRGATWNNFAEVTMYLQPRAAHRGTEACVGPFPTGGTAHEGLQTNLFPHLPRVGDYGAVVDCVKKLAQDLRGLQIIKPTRPKHTPKPGPPNHRRNTSSYINTHLARWPSTNSCDMDVDPEAEADRIPLWVTGHSLGAAHASLFFARFLEHPENLGCDVVLRDCYSFGAPRLGDGEFATQFENSILDPHDNPNILWRVVNNHDGVCRFPPGLADSQGNRERLGSSVLNYAHLGAKILLKPRKKAAVQEDETPAQPVASTSTAPPSNPPLSAVAARKAALAASARNSPAATKSPSSSEAEENEEPDSDDDEISLGGSDKDEEESSPAKGKRAVRPKKKPKGAGRYFMAAEEGERERITGMEVDNTGDGLATPEDIGFEEEPELAKSLGKGKLGRGKRQRRERSAFIDPSCVSTFAPILDQNAFKVSWTQPDDQSHQSGLLLCLQTSETVLIHGSASISPIFGSFNLLGAVITSPPAISPLTFPPKTSYPLFAPSSHPLPPLEALQLPLYDKSTTLLLPDGRKIDTSAISCVVFVSDLGSGIEGVETVLRNGGMGAGNNMWEVGGKKTWGGSGWRLITDVTPSLTSMRNPSSWESTLLSLLPSRPAPDPDAEENSDEEEDLSAGADRMVLMVEGPKHVGKSTFAKLAVNRLLSRYERVAYLDTDLGQPEFTTSGLVSLNVVESPILGPSFTHPSIPVSAHFLGSPSPASDPSTYLAALTALLSTYALEVEYPLVDEPTRRPGRRNGASRSAPVASKIRDRVPLIINTQGWVKGLGADLLEKLKIESRPTHLFSFDGADEDGMESDEHSGWLRFRLESAPSSPLDAKWSAADLRTLSLISYFHAALSSASTTRMDSPTNVVAQSWDFSLPLVAQSPLGVSWTDSEAISSVHIIDSDIEYEQVLHVLNGSVVALVRSIVVPPEDEIVLSSPSGFPYDPNSLLPQFSTSSCLGLALIRSIDPATRTLHLLSPVPADVLAEGPISLVKGALEIPVCLVLDFLATDGDRERGLCGVEWKDVPYFGGEGEGAGRRKVRRNLMRRGQN
ncbi:polynucleotide 5'-hydroxyl-kinase GRC3/NOL9, partial [Phenoliferia sp. Uapishka_3]